MEEFKNASKNLLEALKTERDDLRVRIHLAGQEARDEWEELEQKWQDFTNHLRRVGHEASDVSEDFGDDLDDAGRKLMQDIKAGYKRIRSQL